MAALFGPTRIELQHQLLLIMGFGLPLIFVGYMLWQKRQRSISNAELSIATLAITVFYALVDVPYLYLYYVPVFWYLAIAALSLHESKSKLL
jgi:drug/metabolite transporter (DMT)-like permease